MRRTFHPYTTVGPDGGVVGVGRLPGFAQADARVLYNYVDLPTGVSATVNNDAGVTGTHKGHVWSDWAPRDNYRATVRVGAPSGTTQGVQVDLVEFRSYATGAIPYFPTLRFPGQYADAETEKYINWNRFYDPSTGRYLQSEPVLQSALFVNYIAGRGSQIPVYSYAMNSPVYFVDPDGLWIRPGFGISRYQWLDIELRIASIYERGGPKVRAGIDELRKSKTKGVYVSSMPDDWMAGGGGWTSDPDHGVCEVRFSPRGHWQSQLSHGIDPVQYSLDGDQLLGHELGHAYSNLFGNGAWQEAIDWENELRPNQWQRPNYWTQWPKE